MARWKKQKKHSDGKLVITATDGKTGKVTVSSAPIRYPF